jgi:hypothetical protein
MLQDQLLQAIPSKMSVARLEARYFIQLRMKMPAETSAMHTASPWKKHFHQAFLLKNHWSAITVSATAKVEYHLKNATLCQ